MSDAGRRIDLRWEAPGPISAQFMASAAANQVLNGPVGSGKTTTCFQKALVLAQRQLPSPRRTLRLPGESRPRPVRMFKLTAVRDDYRQLWRSTIPSWRERFPPEIGIWSGAQNAPAKHELRIALTDGTVVEFIVDFVAIGDNDIEQFMRGYQTTYFYLNELDLMAPEVLDHALLRAGRYPEKDDGAATQYGVIADCNAPIIDGWLYNDIFVNGRPGIELTRLPGAFDPGAENHQNLVRGYYQRQIETIGDPYLIRRMVHNQPAPSRAGKPVHEAFNDFLHVAPAELAAVQGLPLRLGMDAGLDPCAIIGQKLGNGHWNIIDELVCPHGTGAVHFARLLNEYLAERYPGWHAIPNRGGAEWSWDRGFGSSQGGQGGVMVRGWCDPAATYGGDDGSQAEADWTWCQLVRHHTGIPILPAPTNNTTDRRAALQHVLTLMPDGKPAFQLSPRCKMVRAGLAGQFRYRKLQLAREERYTDEVDKNAHSHPCEALEYLLLGGGERNEVHQRRERGWGDMSRLPRQAVDDWRMGG